MASGVNTKFVTILIVAVIAMFGLLAAAFVIVSKTPADLANAGDKAMAEGDYETAILLYSKAVNKDQTIVENIEKWIDALEHSTPETETLYIDAFRTSLLAAIHQSSIVQRNNVDAYHREFGMMLDMLLLGHSRSQADQLITSTGEALRNFDGVNGVDPKWPTLRRYRGIAWERIAANDGVVDEEDYELVREDLTAALEADPSDQQARVSLMRWTVYEAIQRLSVNNAELVDEARRQAIAMGQAHLDQFPSSPLVFVTQVSIEMELARSTAMTTSSELDAERTQAVLDAFASFLPRLDELYSTLMSTPAEEVSVMAINNFRMIEQLSNPSSNLAKTRSLFEYIANADPSSSHKQFVLAKLLTDRQDQYEAIDIYKKILALDPPPLSLEGANLFGKKRESLVMLTTIYLDLAERLSIDKAVVETPEGKAELDEHIANAKSYRDQFASSVSEDNINLTLINGRIAYADDDKTRALELFRSYNQQTSNSSARGLWLEAIVARQLRQLGTAKSALENLLIIQKYNVSALLMLADIEVKLQDLRRAKTRFETVLLYDPNNEVARVGIQNINTLEDPSSLEDPVAALVLTSRSLRRGNEDNPGDISAAITTLTEGMDSVNYDPRAASELISLLIEQADVDGARAILTQAFARHSENETLIAMNNAFENDDPTDIYVAMIRQTQTDPFQMNLSIANIAYSRNKLELLDSTLVELQRLNPDHSSVIDLAFVRALSLDDIGRAEELVIKAKANNTDRVNGLSYQARLASYRQDHDLAVQLLTQATSSGAADSSLFRMLAVEQRSLGQIEESIKTFEHALGIRPDDTPSIIEYLNTLMAARRYPEALDIARRFQRYANTNPRFLTSWLTLESEYGGEEGQQYALRQREKFLELAPNDIQNTYALAELYIQSAQWAESRELISRLRTQEPANLAFVVLEAKWFADQGRVDDRNGLALAREIFIQYIASRPDDNSSAPYISMAQFMLERGRQDLALEAANAAVEREDPNTLEGSKLLGNLFLALNQFSNASNAFKKVVDADADEDDQYRMRLVDMLLRTRQFESARAYFDGFDAEMAGSLVAMLQNAEIEEGLGKQAIAAQILDDTVAKFPDNPLVYIKRAEFNSGTPETLNDMLADIDSALQINPNDWRAYRIRAAGYFAVDKRQDALRDLQKAVRLNPNLDQALFGIINELIIDGKNAEAYDFAMEIAQQRLKNASFINSLGELFSSRGDWDRATQFYKISWDVRRSPSAGAVLIDAIVRTRNPDTTLANSVINDLTAIAGDIEDSPGLLAARALVLQARGRDELALRELTKAFDLSSDSDTTIQDWARNLVRYFEGHSLADQINYLESLKRRNPNREVFNWLDLFVAQRLISVPPQRDQAIQILERLIGVEDQQLIRLAAYKTLGNTFYGDSNFEKASEIWAEGSQLFPDDWEMRNNLAYVLSQELGNHEEALAHALHSLEVNTRKMPEPFDTAGRIYTSLGQFDKADELFNEGMKFSQSARSRVTLMLAQINLDLAQGNVVEARSKMIDIRSLIRAMPTRDIGLESQVDEVETQIDSAG